MSGIRHQKSERVKPHYAQALRTLYPTSDLRPLLSAERGRGSFRGFTLLELLMVIGIIAILLVLIAPAFTTIKSGTEVTAAIYGVKGLLENARAYAKANHTYVFVGFAEVDSSVDPSVSPQITTGDTPYVIAQTGKCAPGETDVAKFIVEGEKRYWLHISLGRDLNTDRTVDVLGTQLEEVTE
jgi:prepilin-type N-terminal cleavage/methylation domain-containing protein